MKINMIIKKSGFAIMLAVIIHISICKTGHCDQVAVIEDKQSVLLENVKQIYVNYEKDIARLESDLNLLKEYLKKVGEKKEILNRDNIAGEELDLITKQKTAIDARIVILNDIIRVRNEMINEAVSLEKWLNAISELTEKKNKLAEAAALLPESQYESIKKEIELLKANLEAIQAGIKEKDGNLSTLQKSTDTENLKLDKERKRLKGEAEKVERQKAESKGEAQLVRMRKESLENEIRLQENKMELLLVQTALADIRLKSARIQGQNIQSEIDIKTGLAGILFEKFKEKEAEKKKKEVEEAKKAEEERKKIAEEQKAKAEQEKERAIKKEEIAIQKQLEDISPERKRTLEVTADMYKQEGLLATIKDELITAGTERHKDYSEFKIIQKSIDDILGGENTPAEIAEELNIINAEIMNIQEKINAIQGMMSAAEKQRSVVINSLNVARADLLPPAPGEKSSIEKEAEGFSDKALAKQLINNANERVQYIERQNSLIETKIERLNERNELASKLSEQLIEAKNVLSQIKAANIWERRESKISSTTIITTLSDIKYIRKNVIDLYKNSIQGLQKLRIYLSDTKNIPLCALKLFIIISVILLAYFARRYLKIWLWQLIEKSATVSPERFITFKFIPGLLHIAHDTITMFFLFIISITISFTAPSQSPVILSAIYGFAVISVYKILRGFVIASFSPYIGGRRWTTMAYFYARRIYVSLKALLLFSAVMITVISVLNAYNYKDEVTELLWFIYRIVAVFIVIWIAAGQRSILMTMLPYVESHFGKFINKVINIIYPFLVVFIVSLSVIRNLGYAQLTYTIIVALTKAVIATVIAYLAYRYILRRLLLLQEKRLQQEKALDAKEFETMERGINARYRIYKAVSSYGVLVITVIIVFGILKDTFKDVVSSPAAPKLFRDVYDNILYVFTSIKGSLTYKLALADGKYTSPFKIMFGILVLIAAFICAKYIRNVIKKRVFEKAKLELGAQHAISSGITYFIIGIAALIGLNIAGIPLKSLTIFAGAFGIGIGFGMQNIINNLVSGIIILFERPIKIGDVIQVDNEIKGTVSKISIRSTTIQAFDRTTVIVPNSKFLETNVINWVHDGDMVLRAIMSIGVAYGSDTELVRDCLLKVARGHPDVLKDPEPIVRFAEFGDSSLIFQLYIWALIDKRWMAVSDINFAIDRIFRENGIEMPFPQRDIHIRSITPKMSELTKSIDMK